MITQLVRLNSFAAGFWDAEPDEEVWRWAERAIELSRLESRDMPGPYSSEVTPFIREPLECYRDAAVQDLTLVFATQVCKTLMIMVGTSWWLAHRAGRCLWVMDTEHNARSFSEHRWKRLLTESPDLAAMIPDDSDRFKLLEQSLGASLLNFVGSNSPGNLASRPADLINADEVEKFPHSTGKEADAITLIEQRTKSRATSMIVKTSSPTTDSGLIWRSFLAGDQCFYHVPCGHCGEMIILEFSQIHWDQGAKSGDKWDLERVKSSALYICQECDGEIRDSDKPGMLRGGEWRPTNPHPSPGARSYQLSSLYSPWARTTFGALAVEFLKAKGRRDLRGFYNGYLGMPWSDVHEKCDWEILAARREAYRQPIPEGVLLLTCGVDVQDDRIEAELLGWGVGEETWSIEYAVFHGDPARHYIWNDLDKWLLQERPLQISCTCIDSGGHYTREVYLFCKPRAGRRVFAVKGSNQAGRPLVNRPTRTNREKVRLFTIGTDTAKGTIFSRFQVTEKGPGYCHFPDHYDDEFFQQLTAEEMRVRYHRGFEVREWHKIRPRNEALDCRVYAYAALGILPTGTLRAAERTRDAREAAAGGESGDSEQRTDRPQRRQTHRRRKSWVNKW